eukprot:Tbor_TRINITY_DN2865_c1_g1::TRINITY_DN2865_c1_g1_i1::g.23217::m.23217/K17427/MRPL46; large subunit ribosomal protein L46
MFRKSASLLFHSQHRTPIIPQSPVPSQPLPGDITVYVGYLLHRSPSVKHDPHPIENEMAFMLEREHKRYARHEAETATHFMINRQQSVDSWGRQDPNDIVSNFFGLDIYQDALKNVLQRYLPQSRLTKHDFVDLFSDEMQQATNEPPKRHTIDRALDDYLFLIVKDKATGMWSIPSVAREPHETLRMTVDRALHTNHNGAVVSYLWSNAPQGVIRGYSNGDTRKNEEEGKKCLTFIYNATYLSGRPSFDSITPAVVDHAWVTRNELKQYSMTGYVHPDMLEVLRDIAPDAFFDQQ